MPSHLPRPLWPTCCLLLSVVLACGGPNQTVTLQGAGDRSAAEGAEASWRGQLKALGVGPVALA